jgi:hypothetical protein
MVVGLRLRTRAVESVEWFLPACCRVVALSQLDQLAAKNEKTGNARVPAHKPLGFCAAAATRTATRTNKNAHRRRPGPKSND